MRNGCRNLYTQFDAQYSTNLLLLMHGGNLDIGEIVLSHWPILKELVGLAVEGGLWPLDGGFLVPLAYVLKTMCITFA